MKLSEIIKAISNHEVVDDRENPDNVDVFLMVQDATDIHNTKVSGYINGDDNRLAAMVADRMVKDEDFNKMISLASSKYLAYKYKHLLKKEEAEKENPE